MSLSEVPHMTAFCLPQGQYTSLHLDTKQEFHPFQTNTKTTTKKSSTSSIITGSLTVMRMAQRDTNQSKKKINNKEFKQPQPWRQQCKKKWFYDQNNSSALAPRFLLHLWRPLHDYNVKPSNVIFYGGRYKDESFQNLFLKPDEVLKNSTPWEITYIW